jgi:hypothetical protein
VTRLAPAAKRKPKKNDISWGRRGGCALFRTLATNDRLTDTSLRVLSSAKKCRPPSRSSSPGKKASDRRPQGPADPAAARRSYGRRRDVRPSILPPRYAGLRARRPLPVMITQTTEREGGGGGRPLLRETSRRQRNRRTVVTAIVRKPAENGPHASFSREHQ